MEGNSNQSENSSSANLEDSSFKSRTPLLENISNNRILLELEENGFITPDEKVEVLIKDLTELKYLFSLKLLFENPLNQFSHKVLRNSLVTLADPTPFNPHDKQSVVRLELHIRTWVAVLEKTCFTSIYLSKELLDKLYNSLAKFANIHRKITQATEIELDNNFRSNINQFDLPIKTRNYNIDFLLIHLRDTLHSLHDDEIWLQEIKQRTKELLKVTLNITPEALSTVVPGVAPPNDNFSILSILTQIRKELIIKYPVAPYHVDWRIMLIIQHNLFNLSNNEISKKLQEMALMEYFWSYLEREWINVADQYKFDEMINKVVKTLRNTGSFLNELAGNESLALPHTLWFGILDLAQNLIYKATQASTYGFCYYLAIISLNKAPSTFIQFKAIEILLHLYNLNNELFELNFDQYTQKLDENNSTSSSEKFQNLLKFIKEKCFEDFNILNGKMSKGKEKGLEQNAFKQEQMNNNISILDFIADEMAYPISSEPTDQLCALKCQHIFSLNSLKSLKRKICPNCKEEIEDNEIEYFPQNTIYKNLYTESEHISPSIELEIPDQTYDNDDLDNSKVNTILTKKKKFMNSIIKLNSNIPLSSILPRIITKKHHPAYQNIATEINEKHYYEIAEPSCKEFLNFFPKSYSLRCILAYIYRCLNNYEQAHLYLNEAIKLEEKRSIALCIRGEIYLRQGNYNDAVRNFISSINCNAKINNLNNYLYLKYCAYMYEKQGRYSDTLTILDKLLSINEKDSLILCYYGEILSNMRRYNNAIIYFTKAANIDPENVYNLYKKAIAYSALKKFDKALLDLNKCIKLDSNNSNSLILTTINDLPNYLNQIIKCEINIELKKYKDAALDLDKIFNLYNEISFAYLIQKYSDFWSYLCKSYYLENYTKLGIINNFEVYMYKEQRVYFISNLANLNNNYQFQKSNLNRCILSLLSFKENYLRLPKFYIYDVKFNYYNYYDIIWKINIKKVISSDCFIKFIVEKDNNNNINEKEEYLLKYEDILKLEGLGWIEYVPFHNMFFEWIQLSIETEKDSIDMEIEYVRFDIKFYKNKIYFPKMDHLLPFFTNNVPEAFKDKYLSKKKIENLLELEDIINNL